MWSRHRSLSELVYTATLDCGTVLTYEARSFLPSDGELVPCRRHGYCAVISAGPGGAVGGGRFGRRAGPRTERELVEWLRHNRVTSVHALRRRGFTLRLLAAAQPEMGVEVDYPTGRVLVRAVPGDRGSGRDIQPPEIRSAGAGA